MRTLVRSAVVMAALVAVAIVLSPFTPQDRLILWGLTVLAVTYVRLKEPAVKGVSTIVALVAVAVTLFTSIYLTPAGITTGVHEFWLWGITIALAYWDGSRS